jgi:squalene-hopene/tetraprenyl-beta-curcumene cyclase
VNGRRCDPGKTGDAEGGMSTASWPRLALICPLLVATAGANETRPDPAAVQEAMRRGAAWLVDHGQAVDGSFSAEMGPAVTALAITALVRAGRPSDDPAVARGLAYLLEFRQPGGGIHPAGSPVANYETSIALLALVACNEHGRYQEEIRAAEAFLKGLQWDEDEGKDPTDTAYGGAGYGRRSRPDLSNTSFLIEALRAAGTSPDDPAVGKALEFVSRTQNLPGPHNPLPVAAANPDGGFFYTPVGAGESPAGETPRGGLRSYGSMTYAGLKSMIFAGVARDDPRVTAAVAWLQRHYTFAENPGMGPAGTYYYLHTAAKALDALGENAFTDAAGAIHDWRSDLAESLLQRQRENGSWFNDEPRWMEDDANLVTSYALLALAYCLPR